MTYAIVREDPAHGGSGVKMHALDTLLSMFSRIHDEQARTGRNVSLIELPAGNCDIAQLIRDVFGRVPCVGASGSAEARARGEKQAELLLDACDGDVHEARRRLPGSALEYWLEDMYIPYDKLVAL